MRKPVYILVSVIAGFFILALVFRSDLSDLFHSEGDFAISDTAAVSRIELFASDSLVLERKDNSWVLNGVEPANSIAINNLLFGFNRLMVTGKSKDPKIKEGEKTDITIFSGRSKRNFVMYKTGEVTFLQRKGSESFYAVEVGGFSKIMFSDILSPVPDYWRNRILLHLQPHEISYVCLIHSLSPEKDFQIKLVESKAFLYDGEGNTQVQDSLTDYEKINFYLSYFTNIFYDSTYNSIFPEDSEPRWILCVTEKSGKVHELSIYTIQTSRGTDMFKALVRYNNQPQLFLTRFIVLDLLLQDKDHFLKREQKP